MYAEGNELTLSDIVNVIKDALSVMKLDYKNWDLNHPYELRTFSFRDPSTKEVVAPGEYMVYFHQMVNGITAPESCRKQTIEKNERKCDHTFKRLGN